MKNNLINKTCILSLLYCLSLVAFATPQTLQFNFQNVIGTSADVTLSGVTQAEATQQVTLMLAEIKRLESLLSNYLTDSELTLLNSGLFNNGNVTSKSSPEISSELQQVISLCEIWRNRSKNAFSCRLGAAQKLWTQAENQQSLPDRKALRQLAREARKVKLAPNEQNVGQQLDSINFAEFNFDINGLAKGYIIDHAFTYLKDKLPTLTALSIDIGGDGRYWQNKQPFTIGISHPFEPSDNDIIEQVHIDNKAIAASGIGSRFYLIKEQRFHHILNPRDGWPLSNAPGAIVIANDAVTADAVATALNTKPMQLGIDWVDTLQDVEALVISKDGFQLTSNNWHNYTVKTEKDIVDIDYEAEFNFEFTIPTLDINDYEKPYVAVWITNDKRQVVKNLLLLGKSEQWAQTNKRWWRRSGRHNELLLDGLARPSRKPGQYQLNWDWRDDYGNKVAMGDYQLHIEMSREDGEVTLASFSFNSNNLPIKQTKAAQGEIGALQLTIY
jgi:thiamine biosynthesis lipoprotein